MYVLKGHNKNIFFCLFVVFKNVGVADQLTRRSEAHSMFNVISVKCVLK